MVYLQEVETIKTEYLKAVDDYNRKAMDIQLNKWDDYTENAKKNLRDKMKATLISDALQVAGGLDTRAKNKLLELQNLMRIAKFPHTTSSSDFEKITGELQINSAIIDATNLKDKNQIFGLLDNAIKLTNRKDYCSALIDNFLTQYKDGVLEKNDMSITINPDKLNNINEYDAEQEFINRLNDYRIGLKYMDNSVADLSLSLKEAFFLAENTAVMKRFFESGEFTTHFYSGYEIMNMEKTVNTMPMDTAIENLKEMNKLIDYYGESRKRSFLGIK